VSAAHARGITHRDLKPQNVMIATDGRVKVLDFGLAKLRETATDGDEARTVLGPSHPSTGDGRILGTVAYMSPEQAEGRSIDHRSDLFSLGVVFYEMLTGVRPFTGDTNVSILASIVRDLPRPITEHKPDLTGDGARILRKALAKNPDRRYQTAADLRNDLDLLREDVTSGDLGSAGVTPRPPSRRRLAIAVVMTAAVFAVGAVWRAGTRVTNSTSVTSVATFRQLTVLPGLEVFPSVSPDGRWFVYSSAQDGDEDIYLQGVGGERPINLTADFKGLDRQPVFSPEGDRIAFRSERDGGGLFVMGRTGESVRRLADQGFSPAWSPDGRQLAYSTADITWFPEWFSSGGEIWIADVATGRKRLLWRGGSQPAWSPDGLRLAFRGVVASDRRMAVWTVAASGGDPARASDDSELAWSPAWASNGWLYYSGNIGGSFNVRRVRVDGDGVRRQTESISAPAGLVGHLSIAADGRHLIYAAITARWNVQRVAFDPSKIVVTGPPSWVTSGSQAWQQFSVSPNGERLILSAADASRPPMDLAFSD
jgi:Tol biopolymer transport system component